MNETSSEVLTLKLQVKQIDPLTTEPYLGSMLRGAFGQALRKLCCITQMEKCSLCPVRFSCPFPNIFEITALPMDAKTVRIATNPYIIHLPRFSNKVSKDGYLEMPEEWEFGMTLLGHAVQYQSLVIRAWQIALHKGIGTIQPYARAKLKKVACKQLGDFKIDEGVSRVLLKFVTPFRCQHNGKIAYKEEHLDPTWFVGGVYNRIKACQRHLSDKSKLDIGYESYHEFNADVSKMSFKIDLKSQFVSRYSSRQQRKMTLYGLIGDIEITADSKTDTRTITKLLLALKIGEVLHLGKNASMGFGQYELLFADDCNSFNLAASDPKLLDSGEIRKLALRL